MNLGAIKKKLREDGVFQGSLYYFCHFFSKLTLPLVEKWASGHCSVCETRIVFKNRENQDFTDNARALFEYLVENGYNEKYQMIYMVSDKKKFRNRKYKNVKFVTAENRFGWNSPMAYYYGATAKYFFYTNNSADLNRYHCEGQITINLWHGCGYKGATLENKNIPHSDSMSRFDYAIVPGPVFVETKSAYWRCPKEKILPLGYPRYDWMLDEKNSKEEILNRLFGWKGLETKAVIWMPTFRKSNLTGYGENDIELPYELPAVGGPEEMKELDAHCRENHILLIIKKHPLQIGWSGQKEKYTNIRYVSEELLEERDVLLYRLVGVCDALISDYSSIAVDYLLLDRPIGFVLTDFERYEKARGFVFDDPLKYMPGEKIYEFAQLKEFLTHVGEKEDLFAGERHQVLPKMHNRTEDYRGRLAESLGLKK